jgi:hypothetical protein
LGLRNLTHLATLTRPYRKYCGLQRRVAGPGESTQGNKLGSGIDGAIDQGEGPRSSGRDRLDKLVAEVPLPTAPLPKPDAQSGGYSNSIPDILVRVDVTYLRQDFSVRLPVADAAPWPEMQRFDFLVRTRQVTAAEAKAYDELIQPRRPGELSPYHRAALYALRELTGLDAAPTAEAWRKLLASR